MAMTEADKKANIQALKGSKLQQVPYIYYLAPFGKFAIKLLIDLDSKIIMM